MLEEAYTDWTLVSLSPWPAWVTLLVGTLLIAAAAAVLWNYRHARRRWPLMTLRALGTILIVAFLVEPALQIRMVRKIRNRLAIVVDDSESMSLSTESGTSRYDTAIGTIKGSRAQIRELGESHIVDWFHLEGPTSLAALDDAPKRQTTDLLGAIEAARDAGAGRPLAGIVLLSDGADQAGLEGPVKGNLSSEAQHRLERLDVPINTVDVSRSAAFKDVAITDVLADDFAFVHNTVEFEVRLAATGFNGVSVPVTLKQEGAPMATQEVALDSDGTAKVVFETKPDKIGEFIYTVEIPQFAGEAVSRNNRHAFVLQVIRDKIRVLQVAGRPSWDERFLRQHLKENPNVDLISFFILRTATDRALAPEDELSLIPFPTDKLFTTELDSFDVVIFQNFDYRPYNMAHYLRNIRDAVHKGLGFVMIGGDQSFGNGGYVGTSLEDIIPLRMGTNGVHYGKVPLRLTPAGRGHPVTDLRRSRGSSVTLWDKLPAWQSLNRTSGLASGATTLVETGAVGGPNGGSMPLVAVMDVEDGRSMAIASDSMWRWRFSMQRNGGAAERAYHRFWSNALRWLVRDPEHSRVRVRPAQRRFTEDEASEVSFTVLGEDYQPVPFANIQVTLEKTGASAVRVDDLRAGENGIARHRYENLEDGAYRIEAQARAGGRRIGEGRAVFVVEAQSRELSQATPRPELLRALADTSNGLHAAADAGVWDDLELVDPEVVEVDRRRNIELWDNAWSLALGLLLLASEWALRRRQGYL